MHRRTAWGTVAALMLLATPASAHVTVHADDATRGATDVAVSFRTPSEDERASTVKLQVFFPTSTPLLGVLVQPHPGWTAAVRTATLANPVKTDDGTITDAVSDVTWTAQGPANALRPGQSADFVVTAGQLPDAPTVTFKALQTYSNGNVVRWISVAAPGAPEPDQPAPILTLAASGDPSPAPSAFISPIAPPATSDSDTLGRGLGIAAVAVAMLALGLALVVALRLRRR